MTTAYPLAARPAALNASGRRALQARRALGLRLPCGHTRVVRWYVDSPLAVSRRDPRQSTCAVPLCEARGEVVTVLSSRYVGPTPPQAAP